MVRSWTKDIPMRHKASIFSIRAGNRRNKQWLTDVGVDCSLPRQRVAPEWVGMGTRGPVGLWTQSKAHQLGHRAFVWHQWLGQSILHPCLMPLPAKCFKERDNKISNLNNPAYVKSQLLQPPPLLNSQSTCLLLQVC